MLHLKDADGDSWLDVVELLGERQVHDIVLCLYPDEEGAGFPSPFTHPEAPQHLERATTYPGDLEPPCSARVPVSGAILDLLRAHAGEFEDWGDSLVLYPPRENRWVAAFIPHERMVLVRDEHLYGYLDAAGVPVTFEAPDPW